MTLHLTVSCDGTWPKDGGDNPMPCRGAFPARWDVDADAGDAFCAALDEAIAAGWSRPQGIGALCPACTRARGGGEPLKIGPIEVVTDPSLPKNVIEFRVDDAAMGLFQVITPSWKAYQPTDRSKLLDSILGAYGVTERELPGPPLPPCVRAGHDWTTWEYVRPPAATVFDPDLPEGYSLGLPGFYRRTCKRDDCPGFESSLNGPM